MNIIIIGNNPSCLWGVFSGNILGVNTIFLMKEIKDSFIHTDLIPNCYEDLIKQANIFGNKIYKYDEIIIKEKEFTIGEDLYNEPLVLIQVGIINNIFKDKDWPIYHIDESNFIHECKIISETIGIIYNSIPNKPPLTSIPHSTSILKL